MDFIETYSRKHNCYMGADSVQANIRKLKYI